MDAVGGFPATLKHTLVKDLELLKSYDIKPVFVFSGHSVSEVSNAKRTLEINNAADSFRQNLWNVYESESGGEMNKFPLPCSLNFHDDFSGFNYEQILPELIDIFQQNKVEYLIAPYLSWSQLVYLYQEDYLDAIYGPNELILATSIEKFITRIDSNTQEFQYVDRLRFLQDLNVSPTQLLDLAIAVGCDLQPYTLPLFPNVPTDSLFEIGLEILVRPNVGIYNIILQSQNESTVDRFQRGIIASQIVPVLKTNGKVSCISFDENKPVGPDNQPPPSDAHEVIGQRLPHEYYFYESMGLVQSHVLQDVVSGKHVVKHPLDGGNDQYKALVKTIIPFFKNKEYNLLTQPMARFYQVKQMSYVSCFSREEIHLENRLSVPIFSKLAKIVVRSSSNENFNLRQFIDSLQSPNLISEPPSKSGDDSQKLQSHYEIVATALLRELYLIGFFKFENSFIVANEWTPTLFALSTVSEANLGSILLLLISLKLKSFNLNNSITSIKPFSKPEEVLARLSSFIESTQSPTNPYSGPINKKILAFRSTLQSVKTHTRDLFECILVSALSNNEVAKVNKTNEQWRDLVAQLPFKETVPTTVFAQMVETLLIHLKSGTSPTIDVDDDVKANVFRYFKEKSQGSVIDPKGDFKRFISFVEDVLKIVPSLENDKLITDELALSFKQAGELLEKLNWSITWLPAFCFLERHRITKNVSVYG